MLVYKNRIEAKLRFHLMVIFIRKANALPPPKNIKTKKRKRKLSNKKNMKYIYSNMLQGMPKTSLVT